MSTKDDFVCDGCGIAGKKLLKTNSGIFSPRRDTLYRGVYLCSDCQSDNNRYRSYKILPEEFLRMRKSQNFKCKICQCHESESTAGGNGERKTLYVDHCHKTGRIRGLLCNRCNTGISRFRDSPEIAKRAIVYLEESSAGYFPQPAILAGAGDPQSTEGDLARLTMALTQKEALALSELSQMQELSPDRVMIQGLRLYQRVVKGNAKVVDVAPLSKLSMAETEAGNGTN